MASLSLAKQRICKIPFLDSKHQLYFETLFVFMHHNKYRPYDTKIVQIQGYLRQIGLKAPRCPVLVAVLDLSLPALQRVNTFDRSCSQPSSSFKPSGHSVSTSMSSSKSSTASGDAYRHPEARESRKSSSASSASTSSAESHPQAEAKESRKPSSASSSSGVSVCYHINWVCCAVRIPFPRLLSPHSFIFC